MIHQVCSISQVQELINLDIDMSDASCVWFNFLGRGWTINPLNDGKENVTVAQLKKYHGDENVIPTYTLQDIMIKLPNRGSELARLSQSVDIEGIKMWCCNYPSDPQDDDAEWYDTPIEAAFELLKKSLTNKETR